VIEERKIPLVVSEAEISASGLLTINFNKPLIVPSKFDHLKSGSKAPAHQNFTDETISQLISLSIDPAFELDDPSDSDISGFSLTRFDDFSLDI
jgi:hypothetical protein